ncbi:MAG: hypothetical protein QOF57_2135 [Frankiaceae bacterium]|nr:hypothetical protein [Frankiaceae bacterium]
MPVTRVRRAADAEAVQRFLAEREPATTEMLAALLDAGPGRRLHLWSVTDAGGALRGAVTRTRLVRDRWYAHVHLDDLSDAEAVGNLLQRSNVTTVTALSATADALRPHLARVRGMRRNWGYVVDPQPLPGSVESAATLVDGVAIRPAVAGDLPAVFALHLDWPTAARSAPPHRLRGHLRGTIAAGGALVAVENGAVVGVIRTLPRTGRYAVISGLVVAPTERGVGIGVALASYAGALVVAGGRGMVAMRRARARLPYPDGMDIELDHPLPFAVMALHPLARFRGHRRLTDAVERLEGAAFGFLQRRERPAH